MEARKPLGMRFNDLKQRIEGAYIATEEAANQMGVARTVAAATFAANVLTIAL